MDITALYPVVHDLTDAEYSSSNGGGCCADLSALMVPTGEPISIHELIIPSSIGPPPRSFLPQVSSDDDATANTYPQSRYDQGTLFVKGRRTRSAPEPQQFHNDASATTRGATAERAKILTRAESFVRRSQKFDSVYVLTRQINKGSFSTVWECINRTTGMRYATKIIDRRGLSPAEDEDVYTEVEILDSMGRQHCNTLTLEDFFDEPTHFYIVTDYAQGGNLMMRIKEKHCLNEEEAREFCRSLMEGVEYMHGLNICHRDLKPENILLSSCADKAEVIIADFGLAAKVGGEGETYGLLDKCGTPSYVAPEVLKGDRYDAQADMWSVGVLMYFVMGGYHPFVDRTKRGLFRKICKGDYAFHPQDWAGFSTTAKHFVSRLLQVDPRVRMTATEALQHPWLSIQVPLPLPVRDEQPREQVHTNELVSFKPGKAKKRRAPRKRIHRVWQALSRVGSRKETLKVISEDEDEERLSCSQTMSLGSSTDIQTVASYPPYQPQPRRGSL